MTQTPEATGPRLMAALWRHRLLLLGALLVGAVAGFLLSQQQDERWEASTRVLMSARSDFDPLGTADFVNDPNRHLLNQATVMTSTPVLQRVVTDVGLDASVDDLEEDVRATASGQNDVLVVTAEAGSPEEAVSLADAVVAAYRDLTAARVGQTVASAVDEATTDAEETAIRTAAVVYGDGVALVEPARAADSPLRPAPGRDALLLGIAFLFVATAAVLAAEARGGRDGWVGRATRMLDAPVLARVPARGDVRSSTVALPTSKAGGAYRTAAVALAYLRGGEPATLLVTAGRPGAGVTTTAVNVAVASVGLGAHTALVRAEVPPTGSPVVETWFGAADRSRPDDVDVVTVPGPPGSEAVPVLSVRRHDGPHSRIVRDLRPVVDAVPAGTELVVVDSPPVSTRAEAFALAGQATGVVVVVDPATRPEELALVRDRCAFAGATVLGIVANEVPSWRSVLVRLRRITDRHTGGARADGSTDEHGAAPLRPGARTRHDAPPAPAGSGSDEGGHPDFVATRGGAERPPGER